MSKIFLWFESPYYNFLFDIRLQSFKGSTLTFDLERKSGVKNCIPFESQYMASNLTSIDTNSLSCNVFQLFDFKVFRVWPWPLTSKGHLGSKKITPFESQYNDFLFDFYGHHLSISYRFRDIRHQNYYGLTLTFDPWRSSGVKNFYAIRKPIYDFLFDFYGQHLSNSYRFRNIRLQSFQGWPWPLIPEGHLGSVTFMPFESPYMTSYFTSLNNISLSRTVFEISDLKIFRVWPWPLTFKGHLGSKKFIPCESPYMTSYSTPMDNISISRTVFEIFDIKVFRVWPWPLTLKSHLGSKFFLPFESPYMTTYLTYMDNISLSRTDLEIFDFKVFRVRPWFLTP